MKSLLLAFMTTALLAGCSRAPAASAIKSVTTQATIAQLCSEAAGIAAIEEVVRQTHGISPNPVVTDLVVADPGEYVVTVSDDVLLYYFSVQTEPSDDERSCSVIEVTTIGGKDTEPPLVVIALVKVKAGKEAEFKAAATKILGPTHAESGNITYEFNESTENPAEFATYEQWKNVDALDAHMHSAHMLQFFDAVGPLFETGYPQIKTLRKFGS